MGVSVSELSLPGVLLLSARVHRDARGWFTESYRKSALASVGIDCDFVQDNRSFSRRGVLRGLHYHAPGREQAKLVQVISGRVYDVVVDLRPGSATFGAWLAVELDGEEFAQLFVPRGCAHGFQVLSDTATVAYKVDREYEADAERSLAWNAPELGIDWPIDPPLLSPRDAAAGGWDEVLKRA